MIDRGRHYGYDALGQVTSAHKRLADGTTVLPGYGFGYSFDAIGNRTQTVANSRTTTYRPDLLNRYTSRQVAGAVDVRGEAHADATVVVNGQPTERTGRDFYREVLFPNTAALAGTVTVEATRTGPPVESASEQRPFFLPQTLETYAYDADGNLTQGGRWDYIWDADGAQKRADGAPLGARPQGRRDRVPSGRGRRHNRLVAQQTRAAVAAAYPELKQRLEFAYASQSRRIRKMVKAWNGALNGGAGGWETTTDRRLLYDGWNPIAELDGSGRTVVKAHVWGLDRSGTLGGAGGVGGLLMEVYAANNAVAYPVTDSAGTIHGWFDENGNTIAAFGRSQRRHVLNLDTMGVRWGGGGPGGGEWPDRGASKLPACATTAGMNQADR